MPNTNPSDLDREALKELIVDLEYIFDFQKAASFKDVIAQTIEVLKALPTASGVPEAEAVAWQPTVAALGQAIYMGLYRKDGAIWEANHSQDVWFDIARRVLAELSVGAPPLIASEPKDAGSGEGQEMPENEQSWALADAIQDCTYNAAYLPVLDWVKSLNASGYHITRTAPSGAKRGERKP